MGLSGEEHKGSRHYEAAEDYEEDGEEKEEGGEEKVEALGKGEKERTKEE